MKNLKEKIYKILLDKNKEIKKSLFIFIGFFTISFIAFFFYLSNQKFYNNFSDWNWNLSIPSYENWEPYEKDILKIFVNHFNNVSDITDEEFNNLIEKYDRKEIENIFSINYIIYDLDIEKVELKEIIEKMKTQYNLQEKYIFLQKDEEYSKELLNQTKFKENYYSYPIIIYNKRNTWANVLLEEDSENTELVSNYIYVNEKYQYYWINYNLTENITNDIIEYCKTKWNIILNNSDNDTFIIVKWKSMLPDFYNNLNFLYTYDVNFCYVPEKDEKRLFSPNLDLKLKHLNIWKEEKSNDKLENLIDYFKWKSWFFYLKKEDKKMLKINKFENLFK